MVCTVCKLEQKCTVFSLPDANCLFWTAWLWLFFCFRAMSAHLGRMSRLNFTESNGVRLARIISTGLNLCTPSVRRIEVNNEAPSLKPKKLHTTYLFIKITFSFQPCSINLPKNWSSQKTSSFKWVKLGICWGGGNPDYPKSPFTRRKWNVLSPHFKTYAT